MSITKPFTFVAGTKARANEVNQDFDVLYSQVNSNISAINTNANDIDTLESNKANINGSSSQPFNVQDISNTSTTQAVNAQSMRKALTPLYGYIDGYVISKDSFNPNDTILVTAGSCYDSSKTVVLAKDTSTTKQNASQGASTDYYVYVIGNDSGSSVDILISDLSVTPLLPEGYTKYRKIGNYTTNSDGNIFNINNYSNSSFDLNKLMPNYKTTSTYTRNTEYTVSSPGYLFVNNTATTDDYHTLVYITYGGITRTFRSQSSSEDSDTTYDTMTFPLPIGAKFKAGVYKTVSGKETIQNVGLNIWFFECIGA